MRKGGILLVKYGGNAMTDETIREKMIRELGNLYQSGARLVIVHGGGPEINKLLQVAGVTSEFVDGHRRTTAEIMKYVQMALRGEVNGSLVRLMNAQNLPAVGLSGKDGSMVTAEKRYHETVEKGKTLKTDIGFVGNLKSVRPDLILTLLKENYIPVIAPIAIGEDGHDYNVNADIFAGAVAGALKVDAYVSLTDVNGLYRDINQPETRIESATKNELMTFMQSFVTGGMLPKLESVIHALDSGVREAHIVNGTRPEMLGRQLAGHSGIGTKITL